MQMQHATLLSYFVLLIALSNPIGGAAVFVGMTSDRTVKEKRKIAVQAGISIACILLLSTWVGIDILNFLGISMAAFETAGGLIVLLMGLNMINSEGGSSSTENKKKGSIAVVPVALPLFTGPGSIIAVIVHVHMFAYMDVLAKVYISAVNLAVAAIATIALYFSTYVGKILGDSGIDVAKKVMGIFLTSLSFVILQHGLMEMFPGLVAVG